MPLPLADALQEDDWPETGLYVPLGKVTRSPFKAEDRYDELQCGNVMELALGKYSHVACLLAYRRLKFGVPYGLKRKDRDSIARYYLCQRGKFLDMDGWHKKAEASIAVPGCELVRIEWDRVVRDIRRLSLEERDFLALKKRFGEHIEARHWEWSWMAKMHRRPSRPHLPIGVNGGVLTTIAEKMEETKLRRRVENATGPT